MPAVYVSDLDGTLLNYQAALSEFSRRTLAELLRIAETGHRRFNPATQERLRSLARSVERLGLAELGRALTDLSSAGAGASQGV